MSDWLLQFLGAGANHGGTIVGGSLHLHPGRSIPLVVLLILTFALLSVWIYRRSPVVLSSRKRNLLTALRFSFLFFFVLLLLKPSLSLTVEGNIRQLLLVLVDTSASMQIRDPRTEEADLKRLALLQNLIPPRKGLSGTLNASQRSKVQLVPRIEMVKQALTNDELRLLTRLRKDYDLAAFGFGKDTTEFAVDSFRSSTNKNQSSSERDLSWINRLSAQSPATAIGDSLRELVNRKRGQPLSGIFLITDGANNSGALPVETARWLKQENLPLYVYGAGSTSPRDQIVAGIFAPEVSFVKDEMTASVRVRSQGLAGQSGKLSMHLGSELVAQKVINFSDREQVVPIKFTPATAGDFELRASLEPRKDETATGNNFRTQPLKVVEGKIKVLLVDQTPRWEFRYLQAMFLRDRRVDLKSFLVEADPALSRAPDSPYLAAFPVKKNELLQYDLILLGDVDPKTFSQTQLQNLSDFVAQFGGGLILIAGKNFMPGAYDQGLLEKMAPVDFEPSAQRPELNLRKTVRPEITAAGWKNPVLRLSDKDEENISLWKEFPPLHWVARVGRPKPAAEVLMVDPDSTQGTRFGKMPLLALQQYGMGQVFYVGTDNTWRWRKNAGDYYYTLLWGQIVQRASIQRLLGQMKRTQLSTDRQSYLTGDRVIVYARLYGNTFEPLQNPAVRAFYAPVSGAGGKSELILRAAPEQPGLYRTEFTAGAPGRYQLFVEIDLNTPLQFQVTEPRFEMGETAMNEPLLRELAQITGGAFFREEDLHQLPDTIRSRSEKVRSRIEAELWSSPFYFLLMLTLVGLEWVLRKKSHLK